MGTEDLVREYLEGWLQQPEILDETQRREKSRVEAFSGWLGRELHEIRTVVAEKPKPLALRGDTIELAAWAAAHAWLAREYLADRLDKRSTFDGADFLERLQDFQDLLLRSPTLWRIRAFVLDGRLQPEIEVLAIQLAADIWMAGQRDGCPGAWQRRASGRPPTPAGVAAMGWMIFLRLDVPRVRREFLCGLVRDFAGNPCSSEEMRALIRQCELRGQRARERVRGRSGRVEEGIRLPRLVPVVKARVRLNGREVATEAAPGADVLLSSD